MENVIHALVLSVQDLLKLANAVSIYFHPSKKKKKKKGLYNGYPVKAKLTNEDI